MDEADAARLLVALIAFHDLGKFAPAFQARCPAQWPAALGALDASGIPTSAHTDDGFLLWRKGGLEEVIRTSVWPAGADALHAIAPAIFGHHGRPTAEDHRRARAVFTPPGQRAALECARALVSLLHPVPLDAPDLAPEAARRASWWIAGLATLADWIGSNQNWFPYSAPIHDEHDLAAYWKRSRLAAERAVRIAGLSAPRPAAARTFAELTGRTAATPLQRWALEAEIPAGPVLVMIEDVTGAGKTEAAHILVHRLMANGQGDGAFWGLPTQATANAMYARQAELLHGLYEPGGANAPAPSLVLSHGQQRLHEGFRSTVLDGAADVGRAQAHDTEVPSSASCAAFLADDRRAALLADVGAGTVDQALLAVLPSKFNALRLLGLSGKVLVIDEAHAYDAYMGVEIQALLRFQAALGGSAIVMSATLPAKQRATLAAAWSDGLAGGGRPLWHEATAAHAPAAIPYPLVTVISGAEPSGAAHAIAPASWSSRSLPVRFVHDRDAAVRHIMDAERAGGAVAWVRNTVDDCLAAAAALRSAGLEPIVFHARFAQGDRQRIEERIVRLFGEKSSAADRRGQVLVATQVIEQSLDLDFDAMVSDVAPVDLLVQRAGRLRRHESRKAQRPPGLDAELVVLAPVFVEDPASDWLSGEFRGTSKVYNDAGLLWRTMHVLREAGGIETPGGLRCLIESVYGNDAAPSALCKSADAAQGRAHAQASVANFATLDVLEGYDANGRGWSTEVRSQTRLGDRQTTVRLARLGDDGSLSPWIRADGPPWKAWALSEVRLSRWKVPAGATAESRFDAAVRRARESWSRWEQEVPVLPLEGEDEGRFHARLFAPNGDVRQLEYDATSGISYPAGP